MITLLYFHSIFRWLVVLSLVGSLVVAWRGYRGNLVFGKVANGLRHWTATLAHLQLIVGMLIAFKSPNFSFFWKNNSLAWSYGEIVFYGLFHPMMMIGAIVLLTIGSAKAKRKENDRDKFKTILVWYSLAIILIFIAIPWPFSPFAARPFFPHY